MTNINPWQGQVDTFNHHAIQDAATVGVLTPLTPPGDVTAGQLALRGVALGLEYLRHRHNVQRIRVVVENDQTTAAVDGMPRSAVGAAAKLLMLDKAIALVGQWHLRTVDHVASLASALGVPIFTENGHNTVTLRSTAFRTYYSIEDRVPMMLAFAAELGVQKLSVMYANTVFGTMMADTIEAHNERADMGFRIQRLEIDQESVANVTDEVRAVGAFGPDLFINAGVIRTNYMIAREFAAAGLLASIPMMVCFPFPMRNDDYWRELGASGNYVVWPGMEYRPSMPGLTAIGRWFTSEYAERHGAFPPDNALNAFTDITIIGEALERLREVNRQTLLDELSSGTFETWRGPVSFAERKGEHWHHSPPPLALMQYQQVGQSFDDAPIVYPPAARTHAFVSPNSRQSAGKQAP